MDLLTRQRQETRAHVDALRDHVTGLELADAVFAGVDGDAIAEARSVLGLDSGGPAAKRASNGRASAPAPRGSRKAEVLAVVQAHPDGIEASAIAAEVGIKGTHVYSPLRALAADGDVVKDGRLWSPAPAGK